MSSFDTRIWPRVRKGVPVTYRIVVASPLPGIIEYSTRVELGTLGGGWTKKNKMQKRDVVKLVPARHIAPLCLREVLREFLKSMSRCKEDDIGRQLQLQNSCEAET